MHHFLDRKGWSPAENPGAVMGLDWEELCFRIRAGWSEGGHSRSSFHGGRLPFPGGQSPFGVMETLLLVFSV